MELAAQSIDLASMAELTSVHHASYETPELGVAR
jgi:hypothetical protein